MLARPLAMLLSLVPVVAGGTLASAQAPALVLRPGLVIKRPVRLVPNAYRLRASASLDSPLVVVRGDDVTVDFAGATLLGTADGSLPDEARGLAILVDGGRNVTIRGARIRGYKVAIRARATHGLRIVDSDLSRNWKPRLYSVVEHESLVDWLSFHHNEHNEWLRFGAAMYLEDVHGGEIHGNVVEQGMNALLVTRSDSLLVWNNDFSFNSGLGVGLYRSSDNRIMHNEFDYNVRGHSEGFYHRGQDSAGILLYEQSCRNVIAYNSVTHGGDGLFLWAGQSTMDTGQGGANDNLVFANDFSYAPANGIEATFSRNVFARNRVAGSDYGVWGGYSYDTQIVGNELVDNVTGIAIEHGQANRIEGNTVRGGTTGVRLWADSIEPSDWGYPKHHETRSRGNGISENLFDRTRVGVRVARSDTLRLERNAFVASDSEVIATTTVVMRSDASRSFRTGAGAVLPAALQERLVGPLPNAMPTDRPVARLPRSAIIVDEWGPYDWRTPKLWPIDSVRAVPLRLAVLGPIGAWRLVTARGVASVSKRTGRIRAFGTPDTLIVTPAATSLGDWEITIAHRGGDRAQWVNAAYRHFEPRIAWTERVFAWNEATDPRQHGDAFAALLQGGAPLVERRVPRLDFVWYRPPVNGIPQERWALEATGGVDLPAGKYTIQTISDDAIRVWVDGALLIDHWQPHESAVDVAPLGSGKHELRVQYMQVDGWAELRLEILRGPPPSSRGSPGPH